MSDGSTFEAAPALLLCRTLGVCEVTSLYLVAIFSLSIVPVVAAEGPTPTYTFSPGFSGTRSRLHQFPAISRGGFCDSLPLLEQQ
jgi:hypothetical protein